MQIGVLQVNSLHIAVLRFDVQGSSIHVEVVNNRSGDALRLCEKSATNGKTETIAGASRAAVSSANAASAPPPLNAVQGDVFLDASDPEATQITAITSTENEATLPSFELSVSDPGAAAPLENTSRRSGPLLSSIPPYTNVRCNEAKRQARMELPSTTPPPNHTPAAKAQRLRISRRRQADETAAQDEAQVVICDPSELHSWSQALVGSRPGSTLSTPDVSTNRSPPSMAALSQGALGRWYDALLSEREQSALIGRFLMDTSSGNLEWSPEMSRILDYDDTVAPSAEALLARLHPDDARLFGSATASAQARLTRFARNQRSIVEVRLLLPTGETRRASVHAQCVSADDALGAKVVGVLVDTTERSLVEQQLLRQQHAQTLSALVGGIAHEINNPIQGIMNYAHLIATTAEDPTLADFASEILTETERVSHIVQHVLEFARLEHGTPKPIAVADLIEGSLALTQSVLRKDSIIVETEVAPDVPLITGVTQQLQQALVNLITNAQEALNKRYPKPTADKVLSLRSARTLRAGRSWAEIEITDRGVGIPSDLQVQAFEPFVTTKQYVEGSGLGLTMCRSIVERHGGTLYVESDGRTYTTVTLVLPEAGTGSPLESLRPSAAPAP